MLIFPAALLVLLGGCSRTRDTASVALFAMDTYCTVEAHGGCAEEAVAAARGELTRLDELFSIGDPGSELTKINASAGEPTVISEDAAALITAALAVSESTSGAFDITIEPVVRLWGFYDEEQRVPSMEDIKAALENTDYTRLDLNGRTLRMDAGQRLDFGGVAKGYAADRMAAVMEDCGIDGALISLGGNVQTCGARPDGGDWRIGVQDPSDGQTVLGYVEVSDAAVVTAGSYQRFFEENGRRYHHILDPSTGYPAGSGLLSVTVVALSGAYADALSTALFVMGAEEAIALWRSAGDFEMILLTEAGELLYTSGVCFTVADNVCYTVQNVE